MIQLYSFPRLSDVNQWFLVEDKTSNFGLRIAYLIWTLSGSNSLKMLQYYSGEFDKLSDDGKTLRGAYGPRMRNWVGADQLAVANKANMSVTEDEDFVKPVGIDQLKQMYFDLTVHGSDTSCISVFDPSVDFEQSNFIPDLLSVAAHKTEDKLLEFLMMYQQIEDDDLFVNDLWMFLKLLSMYKVWTGCSSARLHVAAAKCPAIEKLIDCVSVTGDGIIIENPDQFLYDLNRIVDFEMHLRNSFTPEALINPEVSLLQIRNRLIAKYMDDFKTFLFKDFAYGLLIFAMSKLADVRFEETIIEDYYKIVTGLRHEVAFHLLNSQSVSTESKFQFERV